jgi:L-serine deaminase
VTKALAEMQQLKKAVEGKVDRESLDEALDTMRQLREEIQVTDY